MLAILLGCRSTPVADIGSSPPPGSARVEQAVGIEAFARRIIELLRERRIESLADVVHPELGLRLAPYAHLSEDDVILSAGQLLNAWRGERVIRWGRYDGSGEPIELSLPDYFEEFVYDADFAAGRVGVNRRLGRGNTVSNLEQVYPEAEFVEFHRAGSERYAGLDWRSLRLVLRARPRPEEGWWLLALVHDQWTI